MNGRSHFVWNSHNATEDSEVLRGHFRVQLIYEPADSRFDNDSFREVRMKDVTTLVTQRVFSSRTLNESTTTGHYGGQSIATSLSS